MRTESGQNDPKAFEGPQVYQLCNIWVHGSFCNPIGTRNIGTKALPFTCSGDKVRADFGEWPQKGTGQNQRAIRVICRLGRTIKPVVPEGRSKLELEEEWYGMPISKIYSVCLRDAVAREFSEAPFGCRVEYF